MMVANGSKFGPCTTVLLSDVRCTPQHGGQLGSQVRPGAEIALSRNIPFFKLFPAESIGHPQGLYLSRLSE